MRFRIDLKILFFLICFYFTHQLNIYICIMLFAFLHEMGHLIMGIVLGFIPEKIEVIPFGFNLSFKHKEESDKRKVLLSKVLIPIAGPIINFLIICIIIIFNISFMGRDIVVYANLLIFGLNLIPIYPLDGGRILKFIFLPSLSQ